MRQNRILFIMQLPPPLHGASQSNSNIANSSFINSNFDVRIVNLKFANSLSELRRFTLKKVLKAFKYCFVIISVARKFKPDLVYFTLSPNGFAFYRDALYVFIIKILRIKIVFHLHGKGIKKYCESNYFKRVLFKKVFQNADVICLTNKLTKDIENVSSAQPFIVPNGIPIQKESLNTIIRNNCIPMILYLSNYKESKGILILIDALTILKAQGLNFNARLVGGPSDLSILDLTNYIKDKNMEENIEVVGPLYDDKKYSEFKEADIFVFPTFYSNETFGIVNLEAMQFGLPIITTDEGGISEVVINGQTGFVIEPKNSHELINKLALLINDKKMREEMGIRGKDMFFQHYTLQHFEKNLKEVFETILNK